MDTGKRKEGKGDEEEMEERKTDDNISEFDKEQKEIEEENMDQDMMRLREAQKQKDLYDA